MNIIDNPDIIISETKKLINQMKNEFDKVANLPKERCNFETVVKQMSLIGSDNKKRISELTFLQNVSVNEQIRKKSLDASKLFDDFGIENSMRIDLFQNLKHAIKKREDLGYQEKKLMKEYYKDSVKLGLNLPEKKRDMLVKIRKEISNLDLKYGSSIQEDKTFLIFETNELKGLPEDYLERTKEAYGKQPTEDQTFHKITMEYPDFFPLMDSADNSETRRKAEKSFKTRVPENLEILGKLLILRQQEARILGYENYSTYVLEDNMAKTTKKVGKFLINLSNEIYPKMKQEFELLKPEHTWDYAYLLNKYKKEKFNVDHEKIKEYFPVDHVLQEIFKLYEDLLGIKITEIEIKEKWHPSVKYYQVSDNEVLGHFYMDLFSRPGKFSHAAAFSLISKTDKLKPLGALVTNFGKTLLKHSEVTGTLLHELGHIIHLLCAKKPKYSYFSSFNVTIDFVETPSQMMENFAYEPEILRRFGKHNQTGETLPDELIQQIIKTKKIGKARGWMKTIFYALFDQNLHRSLRIYTVEELLHLWGCFEKNYTLLESEPGLHALSTWGHIGGEHYASNYYCYVWSKVIAVDLYSKFKGIDPEMGRRYKKYILEPGSTIDENDLIRKFLGRDFEVNAFLESL